MFKSIRRAAAVTAAALTLGTGTAALAAPAASAAPDAAPVCSTASLSVWVDLSQVSGGAGTFAYPLDFTNTSSHACTVHGYPSVSASGANGRQIGRAATRNPQSKASTVTIPAGGTAHAYLFWAQVANFTPKDCKPATASLLNVYLPNAKTAAHAFFSLQGCTNTSPLYNYLQVSAIQPGAGLTL